MLNEKFKGRLALLAAAVIIVGILGTTASAEVSSPSKWKLSGSTLSPKVGTWGISLPVGGVATKGFDITIADNINDVGLTVTQNDVTNNPNAVEISNTGTGYDISGTGASWTVSKIGNFSSGANGNDGKFTMFSEQGATDFSVSLNPHATMTSAAAFFLPADEPAATYLLNMTSGGVIGFDTNSYMANPMTLIGDMIVGGTAGAPSVLAGDTSNTRKFVMEQSVGGVAVAPIWDTVTKTDVGLSAVENTALSTWAGTSSITTVGTLTGLSVDGKTVLTPSSTTVLANDATITCSKSLMRVAGDGGAVTLDTDPAIADGTSDGQLCVIAGTSDVNTVLIADNVNTQLAGGSGFTLAQGNLLTLVWDSGFSNWVELSRSAN